jgi:hypothetical protein
VCSRGEKHSGTELPPETAVEVQEGILESCSTYDETYNINYKYLGYRRSGYGSLRRVALPCRQQCRFGALLAIGGRQSTLAIGFQGRPHSTDLQGRSERLSC